ncbi:phytanoyl-CoA dioxygenase, peroxisomal-like [Nymphalis io]|uniref:phytanoyl-CoA dioxygenase, peroxisomal-like n=1 Tax=Inachis io TaxID=171585 RepID=UPI00216787D7|nr:phytanoyl-CoA dioxygenase, peroxisomal-like [Nymphalis io]
MSAELSNSYLLSEEQRRFYMDNGYLVIKGFLDFATLYNYKQRFLQICKGIVDSGNIIVVKETSLKSKGVTGENLINKLQDIHYDDVFMTYTEHPRLLDVVAQFIGPDIRVMNSMFINKPSGSTRHPPHQDMFYFPFGPAEKIIASWTAIDDVNVENGCLYVLPQTHKRNIVYPHDNIAAANNMYHGIIDPAATSHPAPVQLEMSPGDTVFFHPLLVHGSGANTSGRHRKCISAHYASASCAFGRTKLQLKLAREIEDAAYKVAGLRLSFEETWKLKSKEVTVQTKSKL